MQLKSVLDYQKGDFCRVYRCDDFQNLGSLQIVFLADKQPDDEGQDLPCLSVKVNAQGAIIAANQFFQDSEAGESARDEILERMNFEKAAEWVQRIELKTMLCLLDQSLEEESDAAA